MSEELCGEDCDDIKDFFIRLLVIKYRHLATDNYIQHTFVANPAITLETEYTSGVLGQNGEVLQKVLGRV
jgi:hypothetical protein